MPTKYSTFGIVQPPNWKQPRQQTIQYTPPGGVLDDQGNRVESFGVTNKFNQDGRRIDNGVIDNINPIGMYDQFGRRKGAYDFGSPTNDPNTVWNLNGSSTAPPPANPPYASNPQPQPGTGPFGQVPGPVGLANPAGDLAKQYPNLAATNASVSGNIASELAGRLSPETEAALWDSANRFGVSSGMPGAGLWSNKFLGNIAGTIEARKAQGIQHYNQTIPTISNTQTVRPEEQHRVARENAEYAAAPDPAAQSSYSEWLFQKYLDQLNKGNPAAGTIQPQRSYAPPAGYAAPSAPFSPVAASGGRNNLPWNHTPWDPGSLRNLTWAQHEG